MRPTMKKIALRSQSKLILALALAISLTSSSTVLAGVYTVRDAIEATLKNHPEVQAQAELIRAAQAQRGSLWERFLPAFQTSATQSEFNHTANYSLPPLPGAHSVSQFNARALFNFSPSQFFSWKTNSLQALTAEQQSRIALNQLALRTIEAYAAVEVAREQKQFLTTVIFPILDALSKCSDVLNRADLKNAVATFRSNIISQEVNIDYQLSVGEAQLELLTDMPVPDRLQTTAELLKSIPFYQTREDAIAAALESSPQLRAAQYAKKLQNVNHQGVFWSSVQLTAGIGKSYTRNQTDLGNQPHMNYQNRGAQFGVTLTLDIPRTRRDRKSSTHQVAAADSRIEATELGIQLDLQRGYLNYERRTKNICRLMPEKYRLRDDALATLARLSRGESVDVALTMTTLPQVWTLIRQLYEDKLSVISELASARLQIGDLATPSDWDPAMLPGSLCPAVNP